MKLKHFSRRIECNNLLFTKIECVEQVDQKRDFGKIWFFAIFRDNFSQFRSKMLQNSFFMPIIVLAC